MSATTYSLTPDTLAATVAKIAKINERAAKKGWTGKVSVDSVRNDVTRTVNGFQVTEVRFDVTITGDAPKYDGWTFLARVDVIGDSFTLAPAPGVEQIDRSTVRPGECDHCGHNRARKVTYVVTDGAQVVNVGSTCLKDFLGWDTTPAFLSTEEVETDLGLGGSFGGPSHFSVDSVLAVAWAATKQFGFVSTSAYQGVPTRSAVLAVLEPITAKDREIADALRPLAQEAATKVAEIKDFILSDSFSGSTYADNLKVLVQGGIANSKHLGLLASAPQALIRSQEQAAEREAKAAAEVESDFIGTVGDKVEVEATISAIRYIDGNYGTTVLYTLLAKDGNLIKWFASREALGEETGVEVKIKGTIKGHDTYNGVKSTVLTRCKAL